MKEPCVKEKCGLCTVEQKITAVSDLWPHEFYDVDKVVIMGAEKYEPHDWELSDSPTFVPKKRCDSAFHHLSRLYAAIDTKQEDLMIDRESGLHHALHLACNALMIYTRWKRGYDR